MPIAFPASPALNQQYTYSGRTWFWNGVAWQSMGTVQGLVGFQGTQGIQGVQGTQGLTGATSTAVYDSDQGVISQQVFG